MGALRMVKKKKMTKVEETRIILHLQGIKRSINISKTAQDLDLPRMTITNAVVRKRSVLPEHQASHRHCIRKASMEAIEVITETTTTRTRYATVQDHETETTAVEAA